MKRILTLALAGILTACGAHDPQPGTPDDALPYPGEPGTAPPPSSPGGPDIDINGAFLGRVADQGRSALLDVTVQEKGDRVNATVYVQDTKETLRLSGTRSLSKTSPVTVDISKRTTDPASSCQGNFSEEYLVQAIFYDADHANGFVRRVGCLDGKAQVVDGGNLELVRK